MSLLILHELTNTKQKQKQTNKQANKPSPLSVFTAALIHLPLTKTFPSCTSPKFPLPKILPDKVKSFQAMFHFDDVTSSYSWSFKSTFSYPSKSGENAWFSNRFTSDCNQEDAAQCTHAALKTMLCYTL